MEKRRPSEKEIRKGEIVKFIDALYAQPKLSYLKPQTIVIEPYKTLVIDTATKLSLLSDEEIKKEANKLDASNYAQDPANHWRPLLQESDDRSEDIKHYYKEALIPEAEKERIVKSLLRQAVTSRTMKKTLATLPFDNQQMHQKQSDVAVNLSVRAVMEFSPME